MPELQLSLVGQSPLVNEPQRWKNKLLGPLPHDQVQHHGDGDQDTPDKQRQVDKGHFSVTYGQLS